MAVIKELIRTEANGTISFGDYSLDAKGQNWTILNMTEIYIK